MQNSELFRRGIVLPLTAAALADLQENTVAEDSPVECIRIDEGAPQSDEEFYHLCEAGVFRTINTACSGLIDDYEEYQLEANQVSVAAASLIRQFGNSKDPIVSSFVIR